MTPEFVRLPVHIDERGKIAVFECDKQLPFEIRRQFVVYGVPHHAIRGQHANRQMREVLIRVHGSLDVTLDDGTDRVTVTLDDPSMGVHLPNMIWSEQMHFSPGAVMVVLASMPYEPADIIRDYPTFLALCERYRPTPKAA